MWSNLWHVESRLLRLSVKLFGRWLRTTRGRLSLVAVFTLVVFGAACAFLRISRPRDLEAFLGMASECHPVWRQFAFHRFKAGDSAQELFRRFPPTWRQEFGRYGIYSFSDGPSNSIAFTSLSVVTKDGKLISAASGSCTWQFTFFTTEDPELDRQYAAFVQERHNRLEQERLERLKGELQRFYGQRDRWPTNESEFGWFVTGEKPPTRASTAAEKSFKVRYGFVPSPRPNPLGVTFTFREDGGLTIALNGEPELVGTVPRPTK